MRINIPALEDSVRISLEARLKKGDIEAIEGIIGSYVPLAHKVSEDFIKRYPYVAEDIVASAMFGLSMAVVRASKGFWKHDNLAGYLRPFIKRYICEFLDTTHTITVSRWYKDHDVVMPKFIGIEEIDESYIEKPIDPMSRYFADMNLSKEERSVLILRLEQRSLGEVARIHNRTIRWVRDRITSIRTKYIKTYGKH